ncbi:uncharacterized protein LOC135265239 [Tribolium castaneum]|uniref:uncharacterized protein LOC135265239 n=1 Tax=Tribolium castaneum TaxID=7070 RepID=UPI0030FEF844
MDFSSENEIDAIASAAVSNLLPAKSRPQYEKTYLQFRQWCSMKKIDQVTENVLLAYLEEKSTTLKPPTLWALYAMLKATLNVKENIDTRKFPKLVPYLKSKSVGYRSKKSQILDKEDISKFINEADDKIYLLMKTVLILGISGALRREELVKMKLTDIEDKQSVLIVKVPDTKTHCERIFTVSNLENIEIVRKYRALRPPRATSDRLFLKYTNGKCVNQNVGINKIGEIPSLIAKWLNKDEPKKYTGHCFRRSSATLLANAGGDLISIKRHGGWRSSTVAESYIEDSLNNKIEIANKIQPSSSTEENKITQPSTSASLNGENNFHLQASSLRPLGINGGTFSSCTFNFHMSK